jgi:hypothetical protein
MTWRRQKDSNERKKDGVPQTLASTGMEMELRMIRVKTNGY